VIFTRLRRKPRLSSRGGMHGGCPPTRRPEPLGGVPKPWRRRARFGGFRRSFKRDHGYKAVWLHLSVLPCPLRFSYELLLILQ
jgi:hypothetical protein